MSLASTLGTLGCRQCDRAQLPRCCPGMKEAVGTGAGPAQGEPSAARFALGVAGDAAGWAALGSRRSLFPPWELGALLAPSCPAQGRDPLSRWACGAEVSPAARAEVGCIHPRPGWVSSGAGGSSVGPYRTVLGSGHSWGVELLPAKSFAPCKEGKLRPMKAAGCAQRTMLELGMETSRALAQGPWPILAAGCGGDPWDGSRERVPPTTWQAAGNSATA